MLGLERAGLQPGARRVAGRCGVREGLAQGAEARDAAELDLVDISQRDLGTADALRATLFCPEQPLAVAAAAAQPTQLLSHLGKGRGWGWD